MSISALLACFSFYSGLYLIYFFFAQQQNPLFLFLAIILLIFACIITPYSYQRHRGHYDRTMSWGTVFGHTFDFMGTTIYRSYQFYFKFILFKPVNSIIKKHLTVLFYIY